MIEDKNLVIRKAIQKDAGSIVEILKHGRHYTNVVLNPSSDIGEISFPEEYWAGKQLKLVDTLSRNNYQYWVLEFNKKVIGFSLIIYEPDWIELDEIYLLQEYHSKGFGSILLKYTLNNLYRHNQDVKLEVVEYNNQAINFYTKFGFEKTKEKLSPYIQPNGLEIGAFQMVLDKQKLAKYNQN